MFLYRNETFPCLPMPLCLAWGLIPSWLHVLFTPVPLVFPLWLGFWLTKQFTSVCELLLSLGPASHATGGQISLIPISTHLEPAEGRSQSPEVSIKPSLPCVQRCNIPVQNPGTWQPHAAWRHMLRA